MRGGSRRIAAVGSVAAVLIVSSVAIAAETRTDETVQVCVHESTGSLRMLVDDAPGCRSLERPMQWVVGGEVSSVEAGAGLVGGGDGGDVTLALDPELLKTEDDIVAGFDDGPGVVPNTLDPSPIASLEVPAGDFAIFAKLWVSHPGSEGDDDSSLIVSCRLQAGEDSDESSTELMPGNIPPVSNNVELAVVALEVVHSFDGSGAAVLSCGANRPGARFHDVKIIAHKGHLVSNTFLGS